MLADIPGFSVRAMPKTVLIAVAFVARSDFLCRACELSGGGCPQPALNEKWDFEKVWDLNIDWKYGGFSISAAPSEGTPKSYRFNRSLKPSSAFMR